MKSKELQPRLLYPARLSFKIKGETRSFPDKKKLKELVHYHQSSIIRNDKGSSLRRRKKERNIVIKNKMAINTYLSIITLNVNGLNAPVKRYRVAEWLENKTYLYAVYKRPTSERKIHTD